jgi:hypothetical protein
MPYVSALTVLARQFLNVRFKHSFTIQRMGDLR